jgi:hypothetical protein
VGKVSKYATIDIDNDDLDHGTWLVKGERGRKSLIGSIKDDKGKKVVTHQAGARGYIDGQDACTRPPLPPSPPAPPLFPLPHPPLPQTRT